MAMSQAAAEALDEDLVWKKRQPCVSSSTSVRPSSRWLSSNRVPSIYWAANYPAIPATLDASFDRLFGPYLQLAAASANSAIYSR